MRRFSVKVNGQNYNVEVEEVFGQSAPSLQAAPVSASLPAPVAVAAVAAPAEKPAIAAPAASAAVPEGGVQIVAPMPGTVLDIKVANGTAVKKGQAILVLEAMKMENDIAATADGTVTVVASKGAMVNTGDVLAVIA